MISDDEQGPKPKSQMLRVLSWLAVFLSPIILIGIYAATRQQNSSCPTMGCLGTGLGEILLLAAIYAAVLVIAAVLNLIDYLRNRKTSSVLRHIEVAAFTSPIWLWLFTIPSGVKHLVEQKRYKELEPFAKTIIEHHDDAGYEQLKTAINRVTSASDATQNQFSMLDYYLGDAKQRIKKLDIIRENQLRKINKDFFIKPFKLCIFDSGFALNQEAWRIVSFNSRYEYTDIWALSERHFLLSEKTDQEGCSKITNTRALSEAIQKGETLMVVVGSQVIFLDVDSKTSVPNANNDVSKSGYAVVVSALVN